jgi:hypothetical protein
MESMKKVQNAEEMKLSANYETLRETLRQETFAHRWDYPLAFWTLPGDRRLPLCLLGFSLKYILDKSFDELANTSGVGIKKLTTLLLLLQRAIQENPPAKPIEVDALAEQASEVANVIPSERFRPLNAQGEFDLALVSEALWMEWRETVNLHGLANQKLGRLAPSLRELPTVIWNVPLKNYMGQTLMEIRNLRTHGEKRVQVILEVFFSIHEILRGVGTHANLCIDVKPKFAVPIEKWFEGILSRESQPSHTEIKQNLVIPMVNQLAVDAGADVVELVRGRLGLDRQVVSVRQQSKEMHVTRARIYQLLEECDRIMAVRWPEGRSYFNELAERFNADRRESMASEIFLQTYDLFFPRRYARVEAVLSEAT